MKREPQTSEDEFIERLGLAVEADGLPRIAGRIMGLLLLQEGPCRANDLIERLGISHGSVSTNTRLLEQFGIVERITFPGDRATYYQLTDDPYARLLAGYLTRMRRMLSLVSDTRAKLSPHLTSGQQRLQEMERFYKLSVDSTERLLESLTASESDPRASRIA